jgi:hypothetical protein
MTARCVLDQLLVRHCRYDLRRIFVNTICQCRLSSTCPSGCRRNGCVFSPSPGKGMSPSCCLGRCIRATSHVPFTIRPQAISLTWTSKVKKLRGSACRLFRCAHTYCVLTSSVGIKLTRNSCWLLKAVPRDIEETRRLATYDCV